MFSANADYQQIVVPSLCTDSVSDVFLAIIEKKVETVNDVLHLVFNTYSYKEFKPFTHKFGLVAVGQSTTTIANCSCHEYFSQ